MEIRSVMQRLRGRGRSTEVARRRGDERKVVLADYYAAMGAAGLYSTYQARPWPIERAVAEAYERLVYVYKPVEAIAGNSARLPYRLKAGEEVLDDHPMYRVLNKQANPMETGMQFRKRLATQVLLSKRGAFVETTLARNGDIIRLDLLPPGRTYPVPGNGQDLISHFEVLRADGTRQPIEVENVRWFRDVHPLDPYSGVTPLEAAGLSAELDFFSRLFNVSFLKNDARPGGIVAIDGELDDWGMAELRSRFGTGAHEAGKLTVVEGQVSYIDVAARPRDMQYEQTAKTSKMELLTAFGVGESVLGYAADRTYENAEQELFNFWTITMPPFLTLLTTGFDGDSEDNLEGFLDTSGVEVLQRGEIARRAEAREEYTAGLISIDEYRERAGLEAVDMPRTRALWVPSGTTLVATSDADQKKLDEEEAAKMPVLAANAAPGQLPPGAKPGAPAVAKPAAKPAKDAEEEEEDGGSKAITAGAPDVLVGTVLPPARPKAAARPVLRLVRPAEAKAAQWVESMPDAAAHERLEMALSAALTAVALRLIERTAARLTAPRYRKGTRHWVAEHDVDTRVGTKAIDAGQVTDPARWQQEAEAAAQPLVAAAATVAAAALLADLAPEVPAPDLGPMVAAVVAMVGTAAARQAEVNRTLIVAGDQEGASVEMLAEAVRDRADMPTWADRISVHAATATINGAREAAARSLITVGRAVDKMWRSKLDEKTRDTHREAHGQHQPVGEWFSVGESLLRYPGDPSGPPAEVFGCRCWASHRSRVSGQFLPTPVGGRTRYTREEREAAAAERRAS